MTRIAALQLSANHVVGDNLELAADLILTAADRGAKIAALPEAFSHYAMNMDDRMANVERLGHGKVQDFLATAAQKNQIWLIGGTLLIQDVDDKIYISCLIFNDKGERVGIYRKMHLFEANLSPYEQYSEASFAQAGHEPLVITTPFGRLGCSVCFDLRFPKLYQNLFNLGAEIIFAPSCFTYTTGRAHWEILLRARAIDTFAYLVAPAQYGHHTNGKKTYGHSMIINPWGEVEAELSEEKAGVVFHDIQLKQVYQARKKIIK
jgi:predicted amidohydrolase